VQCVAVCCSVVQCVAVCCSALQCVAVRCNVLPCVAVLWLTDQERRALQEGFQERGGQRGEL